MDLPVGRGDSTDLSSLFYGVVNGAATDKVVAYAVVSVYGEGSEITQDSGIKLIGGGLKAWRRYGTPEIPSSWH